MENESVKNQILVAEADIALMQPQYLEDNSNSQPPPKKQHLVDDRLIQRLAIMVSAYPDDSELQEMFAQIVAMNEYEPAPSSFIPTNTFPF